MTVGLTDPRIIDTLPTSIITPQMPCTKKVKADGYEINVLLLVQIGLMTHEIG